MAFEVEPKKNVMHFNQSLDADLQDSKVNTKVDQILSERRDIAAQNMHLMTD